MIGSIRGKVILKDGNHLIVDVNGIGYRVLVSAKVLSQNHLDKVTLLYTYTHVKEDALELFGFSEIQDLKLFENLLGVSGIGPRTAMSIFSFLSREEIINGVLKGDTGVFYKNSQTGQEKCSKDYN